MTKPPVGMARRGSGRAQLCEQPCRGYEPIASFGGGKGYSRGPAVVNTPAVKRFALVDKSRRENNACG